VHPDDIPVDDSEFLLRRVSVDPAHPIYPNDIPNTSSLIPNPNDTDGLSVNREGEQYESAESLLAKGGSEKLRTTGGVVAVLAGTFRHYGFDPQPDKQPDSRGHCLIKTMSYAAYKANKNAFKKVVDQVLRAKGCHVRIYPKSPPPNPSSDASSQSASSG
jgi:hypothetical protein